MTWPTVQLGEICQTTQGIQLKKSETSSVPFADSYRYLYIADFISDERPSYVNGNYDGKKVTHQDLVMANTGSPGRVFKGKSGILSNNLFKISFDKDTIDRNYLYLFLSSHSFQSVLQMQMKGGIQKHLGHKTIARQSIPFPPLNEQKRMAAILDKADAIRRKRQQAIQLADDFLRSVFLDMFGDPISNTKNWEVKKLIDLSIKIASGNTPNGGSKNYVGEGITFLRSQNVWKNKLLLDDVVFIDQTTHMSMSKSSLMHKDILMTKTGRINTENSSLGRAALYLGEDNKANLNGHVYFIRLRDKVLHEFVVFILTTKEYRDYIRSVCVGGIDKRQLNKDHLENFPIIYPPIEMQNQFVAKVKIAREMLDKAKAGADESEQIFNALSQKAFAGEL